METILLGIITGLVSILILLMKSMQTSVSNHLEHKLDSIDNKINEVIILLKEIKVILRK